MAKKVEKSLRFPLAGVDRRRAFGERVGPSESYVTPWAINVRGVGNTEDRYRGGSRPGLSKVVATDFGTTITGMQAVTSIDASGDRQYDLVIIADGVFYYLRGETVVTTESAWHTDDGVAIQTDDNVAIVFDSGVSATSPVGETSAFSMTQRGGKVYLADSTVKEYDPVTGVVEAVVATVGTIPTAQALVSVYRDRLFLSGADHVWYASRRSVFTDWDFGAQDTDLDRAVAGQLSFAGMIGSQVYAMIPYRDQVMVFACRNSIWMLQGDPTEGRLVMVSGGIGVIAPDAWSISDDGVLAFLSNDGIYLWTVGSSSLPARFSEALVPEDLRNVDTTANIITMGYDSVYRGFHLFISPVTPNASLLYTHWWIDMDHKALWPVLLQHNHHPYAVAKLDGDGISETVMGCADGHVRKFSDAAANDDGTAIKSHVALGPFRLSSSTSTDAVLQEIQGIIGVGSGATAWRVVSGSTPEGVAEEYRLAALNHYASGPPYVPAGFGYWVTTPEVLVAGINQIQRPNVRGPWFIVWLESALSWTYGSVMVKGKQLRGRLLVTELDS